MAVRRAQIGKAHVLKNRGGQQEPLQPVFQPAAGLVKHIAPGDLFQRLAVDPLGGQVILAGAHPGQMPGDAAHVSADGHFVVVEDDDHGLAADRRVVQTLVGHAAGAGAVAQQGDDLVILVQQRPGPGHAQGHGDGAGGVARHKGVRRALLRLGEAGNAAVLPQMRKTRPAACQQLMHIRLVTNVKNQAVLLGIKNGLDGDAQLHHAQISGQMPAGLGNTGDQEFPDLPAKLGQLLGAQRLQVLVAVDSF